MVRASEQINRQNNTAYNNKFWGDAMYNAPIYGVVSGGTDVTDRLQSLIQLAISEGRRAIYFPAGEYYVTTLANTDQVDFFGDNASFIGGYTGEIKQLGDWASSAQLADIAINVRSYGAVGDGSDETAKIQAAIDEAGPNTQIIGEPGKTYVVHELLVNKNYLTISDISLKLADGDNTWAGVIKIIGTREQPASNITLRNVMIDGNRTNQTGIPVNNVTESRMGIAINGVVSNVLIENCISNYNAGDGIWIYSRIANNEMSGTTRTTDDEPCCEDVVVRDSVFNFNRRHGGALDSLKGAIFERCVFLNNGTDINGGATDGDKGETFNGNLYGNGFDLEGYGVGTAFNDITFSDCDFLSNAGRAISITDTGTTLDYTPFVPRGNIVFSRCKFSGSDTEGNSFFLTPKISDRTKSPKVFHDISILNCIVYNGRIAIVGAENGLISANEFKTVNSIQITTDFSNGIKILQQFGAVAANVFIGTSSGNVYLNMENNNLKKPLLTSSYANLPSTAANGTVAFAENPTSGFPFAWVMQGVWRPLIQQITPAVITTGTIPGTQTKYVPVRDADGTILGYIPLYNS